MNSDQIKESLLSLGFKLNDRGSYWQTNAIFRNGDNQTAIQIYKDKGIWKDYVEDTPWSPFTRLIEITLGTNDPKEVQKYVGNNAIDSIDFKTEIKSSAPKLEIEETYPLDCLKRLLPHYKFYNDKNISTQNLQKLRGGLASSGQLNKRFVFPIFNEHGQIHGFSGRDISKQDDSNRPKWKHLGRKSKWVYPLYTDSQTFDSIEKKSNVIIVESIGDLLNLRENGFDNVLVSFGLDISSILSTTLVSLPIKNIIISLNNDYSSEENRGMVAAFKNFLKLTSLFSAESIKICLPVKTDFGEMNTEDFSAWKQKLSSCLERDQVPQIMDACQKLKDSNKISANLSKKIKFIK